MKYLLHNIAELAERRAVNIRAEAQIWDMLARDLKRAIKQQEEARQHLPTRPRTEPPEDAPVLEDRLYVRINEAQKIMGMSRSSVYTEIGEGRLPVKKAGRSTLIAVQDIHAWFAALPTR